MKKWGGLDQEQLRVGQEIADRLLQERPRRRVVGVEHHHQVAARMGEAVVEVAGLGVEVPGSRQVAHAHRGAELLQLRAPFARARGGGRIGRCAFLVRAAIVEEPHRHPPGRIDHRPRGRQGLGEEIRVLVVARDKHVDGGNVRRERPGRRTGRDGSRDDEQAQGQHDDVVHLGDVQQQARDEVLELGDRRQGAGRAPVHVAQHHGGPERHGDEPPKPLRMEPAQDGHPDNDRQTGAEMRLRTDRQAHEEHDRDRRNGPQQRGKRNSRAHLPSNNRQSRAGLVRRRSPGITITFSAG